MTVTDIYQTCSEEDGEIYLWCDDDVIRPARRVKQYMGNRVIRQIINVRKAGRSDT